MFRELNMSLLRLLPPVVEEVHKSKRSGEVHDRCHTAFQNDSQVRGLQNCS